MGGKIIKTVRFTTVIIGFIFLSLLSIDSSVYGNGGKHEVTHGNDAGVLKKCKVGGTCYTKRNGEYSGLAWFYYDFEANDVSNEKRDTFTFRDLLNNRKPGFPVDNALMPGVNPNTRMSCKNSRGVFVFGYPLYQKTGNGYRSTGGIMFPQKYSELFSGGVYHNGTPINGLKSDETAHLDYNGTSAGLPSAEYEAQWQTHDVSWFCSRQTTPPPPPPSITSPPANMTCSQIPGTFGAYYKGNTSADTGVVNHSYSGTLGHNSWQKNFQGKNYVFAKPGDRVQFYETFCFPIQQVGIQTGSSHVSSADPPGESNFQIFAQKNGSENNQYLFGDSPVHDGNYHTIGRGNKRPFSGNGLETSDYGFTAYSPTQNASSQYACETNYYRIYAPKLTVGYQIPGFTDYQYGCNSADKTGSTTEVGTVISQGIRYDNLRAWYNDYTIWTGKSDKSGKPAQNANHYNYSSYEGASDANSRNSMWGYQGSEEIAIPIYVRGQSYCTSWRPDGSCRRSKSEKILDHYDYEYKRTYPDSHVGTTTQNLGQTEKKSSVYTPYNFNTSIHSYIESSEGGVGFLGARINIGANYGAAPRANELISKTPYATHTREDQTVKVYEMIVDENYPESKLQEQTIANGNICHGSGIDRCKLVDTVTGRINSAGKYTGEFLNTETYERTIPDDLPGGGLGKKYCTRSVIWPASSHDSDSNTVENNMSGSAMNGGNNLHHVSAASCVTIAKKPNFQILGGGIYTNGSIITSVSNKAVGGGLGAYPSAATKLFGSWTEFSALAAGRVNGFGTGAIQGYEENYNFNLPNGGADSASDQIALSPLTISNDNKSGESNITRIGSAVLARLKARFRDTIARNSGNTIYSLTSDQTSAKNYLGLSQLYHQGDTSLSAMNSTANFYQFDRSGNLIARSNTTGEKLMNTLAMFVDGTLTIDRNITIAQETYNAVDDFPQVLIFAKKINITSNVTNIDAWLILDEDYGDNQIDTCSDNHYPNALSCNETLTITGPVFARKLVLNRTAGSHTGGGRAGAHPLQTGPTGTYYAEGSIHPAEVFTLRADAYFWAYRQSLSGGQAYMVYSREIAPRY